MRLTVIPMHMRLEKKIVLAGTLVMVVMALVAALPYFLTDQLDAAFDALTDVAARERAYESLLDTLGAIDYNRSAYRLTGRDLFLQSQATAMAALAPIRERLRDGVHDDGERVRLALIERDIDAALGAPDATAGTRMQALKRRIAAEAAHENDERARLRERMTQASRFSSRSVIAAAMFNALVLAGVIHAVRRALRVRAAARARMGIALRARRRVADAADARSRLLHRLQSASSLDETPPILCEHMRKAYPDLPGALYLRHTGQDRLEQRAAWGETRWPAHLTALPTSGPLGGFQAPSSAFYVPLLSQGGLLGAICLSAGAGARIGDGIVDQVLELGGQVALSMANIELRERLRLQSLVDPLTQLYNRRFLADAFERELERSQRAKTALSLVMIDLDHFKHVNDAHGHDTGDALLALVGTLLRETVRGADIACRYGGEEMLVLLPECGHADALHRADDLRAAIARLVLAARTGERIGVSASFGVATYPEHGASQALLVAAADAALYRAKQDGRNRVAGAGRAVHAEPPLRITHVA